MGIVIVGAGQAGVQLAESLRVTSPSTAITLVGDESGDPYQRPQLSKEYMTQAAVPEVLSVRTRKHLADRRIDFQDGRKVVSIDTVGRRVGLGDGGEFAYSELVLATGSHNRPLVVPGANLTGVYSLRTLADANAIRHALSAARRLVVIGAGFIGLELAAGARLRGLDVTVISTADRVMGRVVSEPTSRFFEAAHTQDGITLRLGEAVTAIEGDERGMVSAVACDSGARYPADLVIVGIGILPNTELAADAGLEVANGIVVDSCLQASTPHVWAIGDCARYPSYQAGRSLRLECVQNAADQAKHLGGCLGVEPREYRELPWFWSHQGGLKLQVAGLVLGPDEVVFRGDPGSRRFSTFCFRNGRLLGAESVGSVADHMAARRILSNRLPLASGQAADLGFDLKAYSRSEPSVV